MTPVLAGCGGGTSAKAEESKPVEIGRQAAGRGRTEKKPTGNELNPELTRIFQLIARGKTAEGRKRVSAYLTQYPDDGRATFLLGLSFHREKHYVVAAQYFEEAIERVPEYHPSYHFLGWASFYLGSIVVARDAFEAHLEWKPDEGDSYFGLGLIYLEEGRLDDAEANFRKAIELQTDNPKRRQELSKAHARLADVYIIRGDLYAARRHLEYATELWEQHYTAFYKLSRVLTKLGEESGAEEAYQLYRFWQQRVEARRGEPVRR